MSKLDKIRAGVVVFFVAAFFYSCHQSAEQRAEKRAKIEENETSMQQLRKSIIEDFSANKTQILQSIEDARDQHDFAEANRLLSKYSGSGDTDLRTLSETVSEAQVVAALESKTIELPIRLLQLAHQKGTNFDGRELTLRAIVLSKHDGKGGTWTQLSYRGDEIGSGQLGRVIMTGGYDLFREDQAVLVRVLINEYRSPGVFDARFIECYSCDK